MFPLVSNFVLSFILALFMLIFPISFYFILIATQFHFSVPLFSCCLLQFIYSFMILKEINITESTELFIQKVQACNITKWSEFP